MLSRVSSHYLIPPPDYFWHWEAGDHAAVWSDGSTMAFARELIPILSELAREFGLPPLGAILIVLDVAKRPERFEEQWKLVVGFGKSLGLNDEIPHVITSSLAQSKRCLQLVASLPEDLRSDQGARLHLLRTLFAPIFNRLPTDKSGHIVDEFRSATPAELQGEHDVGGMTRLLRDLKALTGALAPWLDHPLEDFLRTGVRSTAPDDARSSTDLPEPSASGDLWSDLERSLDEEIRAVASLAKQLLAVIQIPRPLNHTDELPIGGVSDITNKGDPTRLLISELAAESDALAVRLVLNEALYFRRETPPANPLPQRYVLLDNGILLWGRARIYATAAGISLLKPRTPGETVELRGLRGGRFQAMTVSNSRELQAWWSRLEPSHTCAPALEDALAELIADVPEEQPEVVLITHPHAHAAMHPQLASREWPKGVRFFIFTVDGEGRCELHQRSHLGARRMATVNLAAPRALQTA